MDSMLHFMWSEDLSDNFEEFISKMELQDSYRNENFHELYPQISTYIRKKRNY
jgi:hypothetical protein